MPHSDEQDPIIGIDLGTSNCVVAHCDSQGNARVLVDESGYKVHPSIVSFHPNGSVVVGSQAKQRRILDPRHTVYSAKRLIGRGFDSPEVQLARQRMPYEIRAGDKNSTTIVTRGGQFAIPEISAIILDHVRDIAASALQAGVNRAVVTVPANFNDAQRSETATAGAIAGITILRVLNEPTAAALAYGHSRAMQEIFAVYDFGGGTFDVTVLRLSGQVYEVLGTAGHSFLGGDDLDERLVDMMVDHFLREQRVDLRTNEIAMMRMRAVAEQTKIELSRRNKAIIKIDEVAYGAKGAAIDLQMEVTRDAFVAKVSDIVDSTFPVCAEALKIAGIAKDRIGEIILVGGTTKMPYVRDQVARFFGQGPRTDANPEEAVALGASLQAVAMQRLLSRTKVFTTQAATAMRPPAAAQVAAIAPPDDAASSDEATLITPNPPAKGAGPMMERTTERLAAGPIPRKTQAFRVPERLETQRPSSRGSTVDRLFSNASQQPTASTASGAALARISPRPVTGAISNEPTVRSPAPIIIPSNEEIAIEFPDVEEAGIDEEFAVQTGAKLPAVGPRTGPLAQVRAPVSEDRTIVDIDLPPAPRTRAVSTPPPIPRLASEPQPQRSAARAASQQQAYRRAPSMPPHATQPGFGVDLDEAAAERAAEAEIAAARIQRNLQRLPSNDGMAIPPAFSPPPAGQTVLGIGVTIPPSFAAATQMLSPVISHQPAVVVDVSPHAFGIATVAGFCEELIRRNVKLPTQIKRTFSTSRDGQTEVKIRVCQGPSRRLAENTIIGDLLLSKLPARIRGETTIEVTFSIDASGILHVRALDVASGTEQRATLDVIGAMSQEAVAVSKARLQKIIKG